MTSINSNQRLLLFLGGGFLLFVMICAVYYFTQSGVSRYLDRPAKDNGPISNNPYYLEVRDSILIYGGSEWNKRDYFTILNTISFYQDPDPQSQINEKEANDLKKLATTKYFLNLKLAIEDFCSNDRSSFSAKQLRDGLSPFSEKEQPEVKPLRRLLDDYDRAIALLYNIIEYGENNEYDEDLADRYKERLERLERHPFLPLRTTIKDGIYTAWQKIDIPMGFHTIIKSKTTEEIYNMGCEIFKENVFYFNVCDSIKNIPPLSEPVGQTPATVKDFHKSLE